MQGWRAWACDRMRGGMVIAVLQEDNDDACHTPHGGMLPHEEDLDANGGVLDREEDVRSDQ